MSLNFFRANLRGAREIISALGGYGELESLKQTSNIGSLNPDGEHEGRKQRLGLRSPCALVRVRGLRKNPTSNGATRGH
jgi:hypothetical protein